MSFTYTFPITSDIHKIRLRIWDTNENDYLLEDEEIQGFLDMFSSITRSVVQICYSLAFKLSNNEYEQFQVDDIKVTKGRDMAKRYLDLAKSLEEAINSGIEVEEFPEMYFGGVYQADLDTNRQSQIDGTIVEDPFYKGVLSTFNEDKYREDE